MSPRVISNRTRPPSLDGRHIERGRVVALLEGAAEVRLTTVVAPAGFGKTFALSEWAQGLSAEQRQVTWLTFADAEDSVTAFAADLTRSLDMLALDGLKTALMEPWTRFEELAARLVSAIDAAGSNVVTIIDAFDAGPSVRRAVGCLIDLAPASWHFVLAARTPPTPLIPRLRACGCLYEIGAADLRFDVAETQEFFASAGLEPEAARALHTATGGWPAAVVGACDRLTSSQDDARALDSMLAGDGIGDGEVTEEAVAVLSASARALLADAALLRRADRTAWAALAGGRAGAAAYDDAVAAQLVVPVDPAGPWYAAHAPLRLMSHNAAVRDAERGKIVLRRAARWAEQAGLTEDAVEYAYASGDETYAATLVSRYAERLTMRGRPERVLRLVGGLDDELVRRPDVAVHRGWAAMMAGDLQELESAVAEFDDSAADDQLLLAHGVLRTSLGLLTGDSATALGTARATTGSLDRRSRELESGIVDPGWAWAFHGAAAAMAGEFLEAEEAARVAVEGGFSGQPLILGAGVLAVLVLHRGSPARAAGLARLAMSVADVELEADLPICSPALFVLAHDEDPVRAARALERLRRLRGDTPSPYVEVLVLLAESAQAARAGSAAQTVTDATERARDAAVTLPGVPGMAKFVDSAADRIGEATAMPVIEGPLSDAETTVLRLMERRLSRREIATELDVSLNTVKFHARSVLRKLGATSTVEAVERGRELGLVAPQSGPAGAPSVGAAEDTSLEATAET